MKNNTLTHSSSANACSQMLCNLLDQKHDKGVAILSLVDRYTSHFAKCYCNLSFHERQDIRQEVAISLICNGEKVRDNCSKAWVYAVVRNQCLDHIRKQARQVAVFEGSADPESSVQGPVPATIESTDVGVIERIDCLQKIFDTIEAQETGKADIAIYTQYAFGLSHDEISKRSKRTTGAIARRISVLKTRLKKLMNECC